MPEPVELDVSWRDWARLSMGGPSARDYLDSSSGTGAKDISGKAITQLTQAGTDSDKQVLIHVDQNDLDVDNSFTHFRVSMTVATAASEIAAIVLDVDSPGGAVDGTPEAVDAIYQLVLQGRSMYYDTWQSMVAILDWLTDNWDRPDEGIWETRGGQKDFVYSRLMCWVAFDRAIRIARDKGLPGPIAKWRESRDEIYHQIMERGFHDDMKAFVQHYETDVLDASVLKMPLTGFISPKDPRWLSTLDAINENIVSDSLVFRYNPSASPDGLDGDEGTFSLCTFWYVDALAKADRLAEARIVFEQMLTYSNHLGLYSEEIGFTGEQLGNFPQAFTHLALISAAVALDRALDESPVAYESVIGLFGRQHHP